MPSQRQIQVFSRRWFTLLFRGKLSLGETFWAGLLMPVMFLTPVWVTLIMLAKTVYAPAMGVVVLVMIALHSTYAIGLFYAIFSSAWHNKTAGGWRWVGIALGLAAAAGGVYGLFWVAFR